MRKELLLCKDLIKVNLKLFFLISLALLFSDTLFAQQDNFNSRAFKAYNQESLQEKVYLHADKDSYVAGEIVWFKIYNVHASFHNPLDLSKVVYVEILDMDKKPLFQTKVAINKGTGTGSIYLPLSSATGSYTLRAYTNWMKNFNAQYYFRKSIRIINTLKEFTPSMPKPLAYDVQFFPEGGNLVYGIQSKVAFRAIDQSGKGINFTGTLINQKNDTLVRFEPKKFGIGTFVFTPERGDSYKVEILPDRGKVIRKEFVPIHNSGYVLSLQNQEGKKMKLNIKTNREDDSVYLFVHTRQQVKITEGIALEQGAGSVEIDKSKLGDGITHITIFNASRQPVCERLFFKRPEKKLHIQANLNENVFLTRQKVDLTIFTKDEKGNASPADMSLSVFRADSLDESYESDIESYLLLSSDLKGNIESPSYYFRDNGAIADEALDNLMLTHGWRRFRWEEVLKAKKPSYEYLPEFEGHIINGKVTDIKTGDPLKEIGTYLSIPGRRVQLYGARSNENGQIRFFTKNFYGSGEMIIQADQRVDSTARIEISSPYSEHYSENVLPEFKLYPASFEFIKSQSIAMQVQNIYSRDKLRQEYVPLFDSTAFYGPPSKKYLLDDYVRFSTMEEVLREYVPEIDVSLKKKNLYLRSLNVPYRSYFDTEPLILLDGVPVFDSNKLLRHDPLKIQKLEVVPHRYYLGTLTFTGIASFTTYKGNLDGLELDARSAVIDYEGLQLQREFYSPVYLDSTSYRTPDFRNVLYWSGKLHTDKEGKEQVNFYTSDQTGSYTVVVQGLTEDGRPGSSIVHFSVIDTRSARR